MKPTKPLLLVGLAVALAAVAGWFRPVPQDIPPGTLPGDTWALPSEGMLERSSAALAAASRKVPWVSASAPSGGAGATVGPSDWTLMGVVLDKGKPTALIRTSAKPDVLRVTPGGTLPDGARLVAIERGGVVVDSNGCRRRHPIYAGTATAAPESTGACETPPVNKEPSKS